ncbi:hypothetical protein Scep_023916 [Stephania cephalantha]|uniref:Uncharacterized protein n=1 Tax=Stephania cephalantha TaxID=152367 RepID=A0AAP0HXS6_9MAGN
MLTFVSGNGYAEETNYLFVCFEALGFSMPKFVVYAYKEYVMYAFQTLLRLLEAPSLENKHAKDVSRGSLVTML